MTERKKLPRLFRTTEYTTGDDQEWTYEYTWEDLEEAIRFKTSIISEYSEIQSLILHYFLDNPERITDEVREHVSDTMLLYAKSMLIP